MSVSAVVSLVAALLVTTAAAAQQPRRLTPQELDGKTACVGKAVTFTDGKLDSSLLGTTLIVRTSNALAWAVAGVQVGYVVRTPGRTVPWATGKASARIPGGVEPGETREIRITLGMNVPRDLIEPVVVDVVAVDLVDPDGRQIVLADDTMSNAPKRSARPCS